MQSKLSVLGMYNYLQPNDDLFEGLTLPDSEFYTKEAVVNNILMRSAEFECIYTDPEFLKFAIKNWSVKWYRTIDKWARALALEYNPIDNYDRYEEWTDEGTGSSSTNSNSSGNSKTFTSAFDSDTMRPMDSNESEASSNDSQTATNKNVHIGHVRGNIGVMTAMDALLKELEVDEINLIENITDLFIQEFCILVY